MLDDFMNGLQGRSQFWPVVPFGQKHNNAHLINHGNTEQSVTICKLGMMALFHLRI